MQSPNGLVFRMDLEGRVTLFSECAQRFFGFGEAEILGCSIVGTIVPEQDDARRDMDEMIREMRQRPERYVTRESDNMRRDGSRVWIAWTNKVVRDEAGAVREILCVGRDITERKRAEERRRLTSEILRILSRPAQQQQTLREILLCVKEWSGCEAAAIRLRAGEDFPYVVAEGFPADFLEAERYLRERDANGDVVRDLNGEPRVACTCVNVICGRTSPTLPCFTEGGSFWTNSTTELLASQPQDAGLACPRSRCNEEGYQSVALIPLRCEDETVGLLQLNDRRAGMFARETIEFLEAITCSVGVALAHGRAEEGLRQSEQQAEEEWQQLAAALDQAAEHVVVTGSDGRIHYVNPAYERSSGFTRQEAVGQVASQFLGSGIAERERYEEIWRTVGGGNVWRGQIWNTRKDGSRYEAQATVAPIRDSLGKVSSCMFVQRDMTRESEREAQLRQAQKMAAIGTLAGGIAHDFNNMLSAILGYGELVKRRVREDGKAEAYVQEVLRAAKRAADLVNQIHTFSRQTDQERKPMQLVPVVKETLKLLRGSLPSTIKLTERIGGACRPVLSDPAQIQQVLMNLCTNAYRAMYKAGGVLEVGLDEVEAGSEPAHCQPNLEPGTDYVRLRVRDTGAGMDEATQQRVFEPHFTTKEPGEGMGMGLAAVRSIVMRHKGAIAVASEPGAGTTVDIFFPVFGGTPMKVDAPRESRADVTGTECVLLVDDEPRLMQLGKTLLGHLGYTVEGYAHSLEALEAFRANPHKFDVVIADQTMPNLTGVALAGELARIRPDIPVILCSGHSPADLAQTEHNPSIRQWLKKPFSSRDLALTVRRVLAQNRGEGHRDGSREPSDVA